MRMAGSEEPAQEGVRDADVWRRRGQQSPARCRGRLRERSVCGSGEESEAAEIVLGPAGALKNLSDGLWAERVIEVMIHKQHSASIRMLIDMVGAAGFSAAKALMFDGPDPFACGAVT
jgi:hypothetical protein